MRREVRLVQLRGALERRHARSPRLLGKSEHPEDQREVSEGRDLGVMYVVHRLRAMPACVVQAQDGLKLRARVGKRPEMHGRDPGEAGTGEADYPGWGAVGGRAGPLRTEEARR